MKFLKLQFEKPTVVKLYVPVRAGRRAAGRGACACGRRAAVCAAPSCRTRARPPPPSCRAGNDTRRAACSCSPQMPFTYASEIFPTNPPTHSTLSLEDSNLIINYCVIIKLRINIIETIY